MHFVQRICFKFWHAFKKKFQKDLNNNAPHEAIDFIQNSSRKLG